MVNGPISINFDDAFGLHEQALVYKGQRSAVIANNIANADTPNFKARDFNFHEALRRYDSAELSRNPSLARTQASHLGGFSDSLDPGLMYDEPLQPNIDGNTVETQTQQAKFAENALQFQASLTLLNGKMRTLMTAIRGE